MSLDVSKLPELVDKSGYPLMFQAYNAQPLVYQSIADVRPITDDILYGTKGSVIIGGSRLSEREDGAEIQSIDSVSGPTWQCKVRQFSRRVDIPARMLKASDAAGRVGNLIAEHAAAFGRYSALQKDDYVADMLQQGTLTAGNADFFDGTFPNNVDPNPAFIYDGLPWFDTAHTQTVGGNTFSNHTASLALTEANLQTVKNTMRATNAKDERDERILINPNVLIVPPGLERTARQLLESDLEPGSANNAINVHRATMDLVVWNFLDDAASASAWWVAERGQGLRVYDSGAPVMELGYDPLKKVHYVTFEHWFGGAVTEWRYWYNANKAAA
jgi:hypothetical protein